MKVSIVFSTLLMVALISACKKDRDEPTSGSLAGRWGLTKSIEVEYRNDAETSRDTSNFDGKEEIFEFKGDSLIVIQDGTPSRERYLYKIDGNELILRMGSEGYFFGLKWYTNSQLSISQEYNSVSSTGVRRRNTTERFYNKIQ